MSNKRVTLITKHTSIGACLFGRFTALVKSVQCTAVLVLAVQALLVLHAYCLNAGFPNTLGVCHAGRTATSVTITAAPMVVVRLAFVKMSHELGIIVFLLAGYSIYVYIKCQKSVSWGI